MEALPEALLLEQRASFMEDLSRQHLWAYLPQLFCLLWQFLRLQVRWSHGNTSFSSKKYRRAPCHQPDPVRLLLCAPGSATPAPTMHAFFRCTRWLSTFHRGARPTCLHKTELERENAIYPPNLFLFGKKEWERASERERERASMTGESSRARFGWPHFIAECNLPSQSSSLPSWRKRAKECDFFSTAFSSSKERLWEGFNDGRE